ncbi:BTB/POZ domain-containing protein POB1 [Hordeum vulgare]|nr:BTB/POZ domain-containing protein POB1 [Hordeum vulgare]
MAINEKMITASLWVEAEMDQELWVEAEMDQELSGGVRVPNFDFAFNSEVFSNMVLKIEVITGETSMKDLSSYTTMIGIGLLPLI